MSVIISTNTLTSECECVCPYDYYEMVVFLAAVIIIPVSAVCMSLLLVCTLTLVRNLKQLLNRNPVDPPVEGLGLLKSLCKDPFVKV